MPGLAREMAQTSPRLIYSAVSHEANHVLLRERVRSPSPEAGKIPRREQVRCTKLQAHFSHQQGWGLAIATHFDEFHPATLCSGYHSILVRTRYHTAPPDSAVHRGGIKGGIKTLRAGPSKSQHSTGACEVVVNAMLPAVVPTGPEM